MNHLGSEVEPRKMATGDFHPRRRRLLAVTAALAASPVRFAIAADEDKTPVRLMVGLAPGGTNDIVARLLAEKLREPLGRTVFVDNKVGAGQRLALGELRRSAPDGRTLFVGTMSPMTIYPNIYQKLEYDPVKDFTPIARVVDFDGCVATGPLTGAKDIQQLVSWLKANPDKAAFGTPGPGSLPHFMGIAFAQAIGISMTHVPYKGGSLAINDLMGGQVPMIINSLPDLMEMHRAGKIHIVASHGQKRSPLLPEVPTLLESNINVVAMNTLAIYGPPKMSAALQQSLNEAIVRAVKSPDLAEKLSAYGLMAAPSSATELAAIQASELARLAPIVKASGYVAD